MAILSVNKVFVVGTDAEKLYKSFAVPFVITSGVEVPIVVNVAPLYVCIVAVTVGEPVLLDELKYA